MTDVRLSRSIWAGPQTGNGHDPVHETVFGQSPTESGVSFGRPGAAKTHRKIGPGVIRTAIFETVVRAGRHGPAGVLSANYANRLSSFFLTNQFLSVGDPLFPS